MLGVEPWELCLIRAIGSSAGLQVRFGSLPQAKPFLSLVSLG